MFQLNCPGFNYPRPYLNDLRLAKRKHRAFQGSVKKKIIIMVMNLFVLFPALVGTLR